MNQDRRAVLAALGMGLPLALPLRGLASAGVPALRFRTFEEGVRAAFGTVTSSGDMAEAVVRRVPVGYSDVLHSGIQGCCNHAPFAGLPAGRLRIVRWGSEPGPVHHGVRLYVSSIEVEVLESAKDLPAIDFGLFAPAPTL